MRAPAHEVSLPLPTQLVLGRAMDQGAARGLRPQRQTFCGSNHCVDLGWPHINVKCRQRLVAHPHWAGSLPPTPHHCALSFAFGCKPGGAHTPRLGSAIRMCEHLVLYVQGIRMHAEVTIRPECTPIWFRKNIFVLQYSRWRILPVAKCSNEYIVSGIGTGIRNAEKEYGN